ncbi:hypothetical protein GALMADRAFT_231748 [Galerina marginata CBS 339.88]|uniref:Secreted protein n=1 Tax=Galerina marginata (strain CBS 339.88) TaxID=685588 RepID=A0A067SD04_GALM3|nr:hypothetical protein GALMADRAFT_231748 [Galerina marginata CBS 339.88]
MAVLYVTSALWLWVVDKPAASSSFKYGFLETHYSTMFVGSCGTYSSCWTRVTSAFESITQLFRLYFARRLVG